MVEEVKQWAAKLGCNISDIEQIQLEAVEAYKARHYNPGNIARAEKIRSRMKTGMIGTF